MGFSLVCGPGGHGLEFLGPRGLGLSLCSFPEVGGEKKKTTVPPFTCAWAYEVGQQRVVCSSCGSRATTSLPSHSSARRHIAHAPPLPPPLCSGTGPRQDKRPPAVKP